MILLKIKKKKKKKFDLVSRMCHGIAEVGVLEKFKKI